MQSGDTSRGQETLCTTSQIPVSAECILRVLYRTAGQMAANVCSFKMSAVPLFVDMCQERFQRIEVVLPQEMLRKMPHCARNKPRSYTVECLDELRVRACEA